MGKSLRLSFRYLTVADKDTLVSGIIDTPRRYLFFPSSFHILVSKRVTNNLVLSTYVRAVP